MQKLEVYNQDHGKAANAPTWLESVGDARFAEWQTEQADWRREAEEG